MPFDLFGLFRKKPVDPAEERLRAEVKAELVRLRATFDDRLTQSGQIAADECLADDDLVMAVEVMAEYLGGRKRPITAAERASMVLVGEKLKLGDWVPVTLEDCPRHTDPGGSGQQAPGR